MNNRLLFKDESYAIRGAIFEVYKEKGCGFAEAVYQECLEIELGLRGIPFVAHPKLHLQYKGRLLKAEFVPDLICFDKVVVELKAVSQLIEAHRAQIQNYLRGTTLTLGMLVNFGHYPCAEIERIAAEQGRYSKKLPQVGI